MTRLTLALLFAGSVAHAQLTLDNGTGNTTFRVDGREVSAVEAMNAAIAGKTVFKCKPKDAKGEKRFYSQDGKALSEVVECTPQIAKVNAKTGNVSFKAAKK